MHTTTAAATTTSSTVITFSTTTASNSTTMDHHDDLEILPEENKKLNRKKRRAEKQKKRKREQQKQKQEEISGGEEEKESIESKKSGRDDDDRVKKKRKLTEKKDSVTNANGPQSTMKKTKKREKKKKEKEDNDKKEGAAALETIGFEDRKGETNVEEKPKGKAQHVFPYGNFNKYYNVRDAQRIGKMSRVFVMEDHFALLASNALGEPYTNRPNLARLIEENSIATTETTKKTNGKKNKSKNGKESGGVGGGGNSNNAPQDLSQQSALIEKFMKNKKLMDIGCNSGILTVQMAKYLHLNAVLGVDIDSGLVRRAWKLRNAYVSAKAKADFLAKFERQKSGTTNTNASNEGSSGNVGQEMVIDLENSCIPNSIDDMEDDDDVGGGGGGEEESDGQRVKEDENDVIDIATSVNRKNHDDIVAVVAKQLDKHMGTYKFAIQGADRFPENVRFSTFNYVLLTRLLNDMQKDILKTKFDIVTCFSVTKWIHLNFGDRGIERLFRQIYDNLTEDGVFVLEVQNFRSYRKRRSMTKRIAAIYPTIKLRPKDFPQMLVDKFGFACYETRFVSREEKLFKHFNRPIFFFYKQKPPGFDERHVAITAEADVIKKVPT